MRQIALLLFALFSSPAFCAEIAAAKKDIARIDQALEENFGVFIKDLRSGDFVSYEASRPWYLASTTKIPIAIAFLREVEAKRFTLSDLTVLRNSDKVDGMGRLQNEKQGMLLSFDFLLEQMITHSDSTAADILLRVTTPEKLNEFMRETEPGKFGTFTSLLDVRRHAYSEIHPAARYLPNEAFYHSFGRRRI